MSSNFQVSCTYKDIIEKFASFIYNSCHNLALWDSVPVYAKTGYTQTFPLKRTHEPRGTKYIYPGPSLFVTWSLISNGITQSTVTKDELYADIIEYSAATENPWIDNKGIGDSWITLRPYSENIIQFISYLLSYCYAHLFFQRQVYSATYESQNIIPCTFLTYSKTAVSTSTYQLKIIENNSIPAEVIYALTEVENQEFIWNPPQCLDTNDDYGAYKAIFEMIKQRISVNNIKYKISWFTA